MHVDLRTRICRNRSANLTSCIDMPILVAMSKETTALRLDTTLLEAMRRVKLQDGIPVTTQIEMAVREWLVKRGALKKVDRRRAPRTHKP